MICMAMTGQNRHGHYRDDNKVPRDGHGARRV
jgi:hypothetical protein